MRSGNVLSMPYTIATSALRCTRGLSVNLCVVRRGRRLHLGPRACIASGGGRRALAALQRELDRCAIDRDGVRVGLALADGDGHGQAEYDGVDGFSLSVWEKI